MYKELTYNSIIKRYITQLKNGQGFEQTFLQRKYANGHQAHEKMLNAISHQKNVKTTMRYFFTLTRMVESISQIIAIVDKDMEKSELLYTASGSVKGASHFEK